MLDDYAISKRCNHLRKNHLFYQGDDKCTKCDCASHKGVYEIKCHSHGY